MTQSLKLKQLTKTYQGVTALSDISFNVAPGERVALLGHNGAGKSTMMKIILGLIGYDSGEIEVMGATAGSASARAATAYLPENVAFHPALTGLEQLRYYLSLRGENPDKAGALLARVGLEGAAKRRIGTYSKGMRQRVGLAQTLIGKPKLLVLDEPTSGLDPVSRRDFYELLDGLAADGASILLSSHALTEVEARTDRILILSKGRMVANASLPELRAAAALPVNLHIIPRKGGEAMVQAALPEAIVGPDHMTITCAQTAKLAILRRITALGDHVADLEVLPPSLEDIFSHFSRRDGQ